MLTCAWKLIADCISIGTANILHLFSQRCTSTSRMVDVLNVIKNQIIAGYCVICVCERSVHPSIVCTRLFMAQVSDCYVACIDFTVAVDDNNAVAEKKD